MLFFYYHLQATQGALVSVSIATHELQNSTYTIFTTSEYTPLFALPLSRTQRLFHILRGVTEESLEGLEKLSLTPEQMTHLQLPLVASDSEYISFPITTKRINLDVISSVGPQLSEALNKMAQAQEEDDRDSFSFAFSDFFCKLSTRQQLIHVCNLFDYLSLQFSEQDFLSIVEDNLGFLLTQDNLEEFFQDINQYGLRVLNLIFDTVDTLEKWNEYIKDHPIPGSKSFMISFKEEINSTKVDRLIAALNQLEAESVVGLKIGREGNKDKSNSILMLEESHLFPLVSTQEQKDPFGEKMIAFVSLLGRFHNLATFHIKGDFERGRMEVLMSGVMQLSNLKCFHIEGGGGKQEMKVLVPALGKLSNLTCCHIGGIFGDEEVKGLMLVLGDLPHFKSLALGMWVTMEKDLAPVLANATYLTSLFISISPESAAQSFEGEQTFALALPMLSKLKCLFVMGIFESKGMKALVSALPELKKLTVLYIHGFYKDEEAQALALALPSLSHLRLLFLYGKFDKLGMQILIPEIAKLPNLVLLNITGKFQDDKESHVILETLPKNILDITVNKKKVR